MNKVVLVFGGLGNAKSSVVGLYENLLHTLSSHFDVVAIDLQFNIPNPVHRSFNSLTPLATPILMRFYMLTHTLMLLPPLF